MHGMELAAPGVLIVCDSEDHRVTLRRHVEALGVPQVEAADCAEAIRIAQGRDLALILVDLQQPMMDGMEAVRLLRQSPRTALVPLILIAKGRASLSERQRLGSVALLRREDLDFDALEEQMRMLLSLHLRANALQMQIHAFLDEQARMADANPQVRALQPGLYRHLLLDLLTGLPNRMYFELHLMAAIRRGARGGKGFALVWMDVDHLQRINQRHHRQVGDALLLAIAQRLETQVRASDVLARSGGDSFVLLLDGVTVEMGAQKAIAKLLKAVGEPLAVRDEKGLEQTLIPTLSIGVALFPRHAEDETGLYEMAQRAATEVARLGGDGLRMADAPRGTR